MRELRKDYLLEKWALFSTERGKRPHEFKGREPAQQLPEFDQNCPFCPGNESLTPPEIERIEREGHWVARAFPNKFVAVSEEKSGVERKEFLQSFPATGKHEVVVDVRKHNQALEELPAEEIAVVLKLLAGRLKALEGMEGIEEVNIFKNFGASAGASLPHSHIQVIALDWLSTRTMAELDAFNSFMERHQQCPYCRVVGLESKSERMVGESEHFLCLAPFASRSPFELLVLPKEHLPSLASFGEEQLLGLAAMMKKALSAVSELTASYNWFFKNSPKGRDFHFYLSIRPRTSIRAGFEEMTDCIINTVSPEDAAEFHRGAFSKR